jgi:hypothetical protein
VPARIIVTANLSINYRAPTKADQVIRITSLLIHVLLRNGFFQFIVIKTSVTEQKGRKVLVSAVVEDMNGNILQDATCVNSFRVLPTDIILILEI